MSQAEGFSASALRKSYRGRAAVDGIDLSVSEGEVFGLLGPNGAGKTTTVELLAGLRRADAGTVRVLGLDPVRERRRVRQVLGVQLQSAYLHHSLTVRELISLYGSFYPAPRGVDESIGLVELHDKADTRFEKLSGGQQQRLSVALALVGRPRAVILDEITTGLDPSARRRIWSTIERLRDEGVTVLMVSHAMDEVERLCDRIALLQRGRIVASGTPASVTEESAAVDLEGAFLALTGHPADEGAEA